MDALTYAKQIAYSSKAVVDFTYEMAVKFKDSPGVYVECGVAAGAQIIAMAYGAPDKTIYAFDSFEGIPLPSNRDDQMPGIAKLKEWQQKALPDPGKQVLESSGATAVGIETFMENLRGAGIDKENIIPVPGWFERTVPHFVLKNEREDSYFGLLVNKPFEIAILRLDGDLYNSTWVCLQHLFPKVINGGCVIIDDWSLLGCRDACKEYFALIGYQPDYNYLDGTAYFFK